MPITPGDMVHLHRDGTSVVIELCQPVPRLVHWGPEIDDSDEAVARSFAATADPPMLNNSIDEPRRFSLWPSEAEGWAGMPAHEGHIAGTATTPRVQLVDDAPPESVAEHTLTLRLDDTVAGLDITVAYRLLPGGVLAVTPSVRRRENGDALYDLAAVRTMLPVPARADELLDFTGKWCRERAPQRRRLGLGSYVRESRRGKPGHDSPYLMALGVPGFGFRSGEVWAVHVGWSGDQRYVAERLPEGAGVHGAVLGGGELLRPGEIRLGPGQIYTAPTCYFGYSDRGLDGLADGFHQMIRSRRSHPHTPRPLIVNTWEAVYYHHDLDRLNRLAEVASSVGVEMLVLDDGWFTGRRDDTAGLGDWTVDEAVWPDGLAPLVDRVHGMGMRFGLWVEPEMVSIDSDLARQHRDWILGPSVGLGPTARHQYVLDLGNDHAWQYVLKHLDTLVIQYGIDFLKWDHNRDLLEAVSNDRPGGHSQTQALYRLLDALRERHPGLEIESCAGGGGRIDLGMVDHTDRVWASDCNDPIERQLIQRWTTQLLPPELVGAHVGGTTSHTTGRITSRSFRLATALFGHAGIETDLTTATDAELAQLTSWAGLYRELRPLLHTGQAVRADLEDPNTLLHGVVSQNQDEALFCWVQMNTSPGTHPGRIPLPGLADQCGYVLRIRDEIGLPSAHQIAMPSWVGIALARGLPIAGSVLTRAGLPMPSLNPGNALLIHVVAAQSSSRSFDSWQREGVE